MASLAERTFYQHLIDGDSLTFLVQEGIDYDVLPTEALRPMYHWCIQYFLNGGLTMAPTLAVMREEWGDLLDDMEIDLEDDAEGTIEWAVDKLKSTYVYQNTAQWAKNLITTVADEEGHIDRVGALGDFAADLLQTAASLESRTYRIEIGDGIDESIRNHNIRSENRVDVRGMRLGIRQVDLHTHGILDGELAILAAGPKVGKSMFVAHAALAEWQREDGRAVCLYTLENSIAMTYDRLACLAMKIDPTKWQRGLCSEDEVERVQQWREYVTNKNSDRPFWVLQPPMGRQGFVTMVAEARAREAKSLIIDQLTFVEFPSDGRKNKSERIGDGLHQLKKLISGGRHPMACLLAHQINREGVKAAEKTDRPEMHHMADSSEVERTADWVFALWRSRDDLEYHRARLFTLASRRETLKHWMLRWHLDRGMIEYKAEFNPDAREAE